MMESCAGDNQLYGALPNIKHEVNVMAETVNHTSVDVSKLMSDLEKKYVTLENQLQPIESMLLQMEGAAVICKKTLHQIQTYQKTVCDTSIYNIDDVYQQKIETPLGYSYVVDIEILYPLITKDNPFIELGERFLNTIAAQPFFLLSAFEDCSLLLIQYAELCDFQLKFEVDIQLKTEDSETTFDVELHLKHLGENFIIARKSGADEGLVQKEMSMEIIMYLSQICKIIVAKSFTEMKCKPVHLFTAEPPTYSYAEYYTSQELKREENIQMHLINSTSENYKKGPTLNSVDLFVIQEELINTMNTYILSDENENLIFMPEVCVITQGAIQKLISKKYITWLEPIVFINEGLQYLVIQKKFNVKKITEILESSGGENGHYQLFQPGTFKDCYWNQQNGLSSKDNLTNQDVNYFFPCKFPASIPIHRIQPFHPSLKAVSFLRKYSLVIEDRLHRDYQAILLNFGHFYNLCFDYKVIESNTKEQSWGDQATPSRWLSSLTLLWLDKSFKLGAGCGHSRIAAINDASKSALVILSGICNIIIRKTCRDFNTKHQVFLEVFEATPSKPSSSGYRSEEKKADVWTQEITHQTSFSKLSSMLDNFQKDDCLNDLVFLPTISQFTRRFINGTVMGIRYQKVMKVINFEKNGQIYLSIMKIIHPHILTETLQSSDLQKDQYKMYPPGTLDISFLWNRSEGYNEDGNVITPMAVPDVIDIRNQLIMGVPKIPPRLGIRKRKLDTKKTFSDLMNHLAGNKPVTPQTRADHSSRGRNWRYRNRKSKKGTKAKKKQGGKQKKRRGSQRG